MRTETEVGSKEVEVDGDAALEMNDENNAASFSVAEKLNVRNGSAILSNRHEYQKRLLTFQASTYYAKPPCLSPIFCARFG